MTRKELNEKLQAVKEDSREALQTVFDELNGGQQKKIVKNELVRVLLDRYGVVYEES